MVGPHVESSVIGRNSELGEIEAWLTGAEGEPPALIVEGEPGIGKTTVWREAVRRARALGMWVLECRPAESELKLGYSALADLLDGVSSGHLAALPDPQRLALEAALLRVEAPDHMLDPRTVATGFLSLLGNLSSEARLVLAIDDLQWLDAPTAQALEFAARRLDNRVRLIATLRQAGESPIALPSDQVRRLPLDSLSLAAVHRLLVTRVGRSFPRLILVKIRQTSRGNPLYALEIARALIRSGAAVSPGEALPVPGSLTGLLLEHIGGLPERTRDVLRFVALAENLSLDTLTQAGFEDPAAVLEPALREGIVVVNGTAVRFAHPLMASVVIAGTSRRRVRETHRLLAAHTSSSEAGAVHKALATEGHDRTAADDLDSAADIARRRGAPLAGGELLELASRLTPLEQHAKIAERIRKAAESYFAAGELGRAGTLLRELAPTLPSGEARARTLQLLGQICARSQSFTEARECAEEALRCAGDEPRLRTAIELDLGFAAFCLGDLRGAVEHASAALSNAERGADDAIRAEALACLNIAEFFVGHGLSESRMADALALEDPSFDGPLELRPKFIQALILLWTTRFDEAISILRSLRTDAIERGHDLSLAFISFYLSLASLWKGEVGNATDYAQQCEEGAALNGEPMLRAVALSMRALIDVLDAPPDRVREEAAQALDLFKSANFVVYTTWPLLALGQLELSLGNPGRVDELLRPLADALTSIDAGDPILGVVLPDEIEAVVELGDLHRAARYAHWLERASARLDRAWGLALSARCRALISAASGDLESALQASAEALAVHDCVPVPFERARTLFVKGQIHRRRREKRLATEALTEALKVFESLGAVRWSARCQAELARVGSRRRAHGLTPSERRVAELAAAGMTNREVAKSAFISPKTVEANLVRVYSKLGIRSRAQLARALDELMNNPHVAV